jgi:hypothetical protein
MYTIDQNDRIVVLREIPRSSIGAPCPVILADELTLVLAFYIGSKVPPGWDGIPREISIDSTSESVALITFQCPCAHILSEISDTTIYGHPLAARGLGPYSAVEVVHSSWIRQLEHLQATRASPHPQAYAALRHFIRIS